VAVEGWFSDGVSVLAAWNRAGLITVTSTSHTTAALAAAMAASYGSNAPVQVGKSLLAVEPALGALWHEPAQGTTSSAVKELGRLLSEGALRFADSEELTRQVMALRVQPAPDGPRLVSKRRADAVKALVWAVAQAKAVPEVPAVF
jgi:phage terminase large subunit-like protein